MSKLDAEKMGWILRDTRLGEEVRWGVYAPSGYMTSLHRVGKLSAYRGRAITRAASLLCHLAGERRPCTSYRELEDWHPDWRRRTWRKLYRAGYRVVRLRLVPE